ncbi:MAG: hypothetical protein WA419_10395 [Silvibacterium sp.]
METIPAATITITAISWIVAKISASSCKPPSDVDALVRLLSNLDSFRSGLEFKFELFTSLVVIGVAIEVFVVIFEFLENRREYRKALELWEGGKIPSPHRPLLKEVLIGLLGAVFVAVGVAGEWWYEERIGNADTCLQQADNARATLLEQEAGTAASSATKAQGSADKAGTDAKDAKKTAGAVSVQAKETAEALKKEKAEAAELQNSLLPRSFNQTEAAEKLTPLRGPRVSIETVPDFESRHTAELIRATFVNAKWDVDPIIRVRFDEKSVVDFHWPGIWVDTNCSWDNNHSYAEARACTDTLSEIPKILSAAGLADIKRGWPETETPFNSLIIRVGLKKVAGESDSGVLLVNPQFHNDINPKPQ